MQQTVTFESHMILQLGFNTPILGVPIEACPLRSSKLSSKACSTIHVQDALLIGFVACSS